MKEIWKDIPEYNGLYQVSNYGRVKSYWNGKERILKPRLHRDGYLFVGLCKDGKRKFFTIHRLVAMHFLPNPNNLPVVNHIDEDKQNNCVTNLEWCSIKYNNTYNDRHKKVAEKLSIPVIQIDPSTNKVINVYPSAHEAARLGGFSNGHINSCCRGKLKTHGGYKWMYLYQYISNMHPNIKTINLFNKTYEVNQEVSSV